jgi:hypothetical protein
VVQLCKHSLLPILTVEMDLAFVSWDPFTLACIKNEAISGSHPLRHVRWSRFPVASQKAFSPIVFAGGTVIASQVANAIAYQGATLSPMKFPVIAYAVLAIILLVSPLLVVSPVLHNIKNKALLEYGAPVTEHNRQFDQKWIQNKQSPNEVILGSNDPCSLIDLGSSFLVVRQMGIVPVDKPTLITLAMAAALPMVPVFFLAIPADELLHFVLQMLG